MDVIPAEKKPRYFSVTDALKFKEDIIDTWKPASEVWAFKYGDAALGCITTFGSIVITYMFRKPLKLRAYARLTCYLPVVGISAMSTCMFQEIVITSDIVQAKSCPLCISTKSSIGQVSMGVLYPMFAASTVCFFMADRLLTYPVPPLVKAPREVFHLFQKLVRKNPKPYFVIGAIHMIAASVITFYKQKNFMNLNFNKKGLSKY